MSNGESDSIVMKKTMTRSEANELGLIAAGDVAKIADLTASLLASSFSKKPIVTVCIDQMFFSRPVRVGEVLVTKASINCVKTSSMEVGVRMEIENFKTGTTEHVSSIYMVLVAVDKNFKPAKLPPLKLKTPEQKRRFKEAMERFETRLEKRNPSGKKK